MAHRTGKDRLTFCLFVTPLEELIAADNMARVVDTFVDAIDLEQLGFVRVKARRCPQVFTANKPRSARGLLAVERL